VAKSEFRHLKRFKRFGNLRRKNLEACLRASHRQAYIRLAPYADDAAEIREQALSLKKRRTQIH